MPLPASVGSDPSPVDVLVGLLPDHGDPAADHRMLAALAAHLLSLPPAAAVTHLCPACGSVEHGRPMLVSADGDPVPGVHVSLSRAGGQVALAATLAAPVGIDIESLAAARASAFDDVAFDDHERAALQAAEKARGIAAANRMRTLAWTAKEAALKAVGTGLRTDPREVHLDLTTLERAAAFVPREHVSTPLTLREVHGLDRVAGLLGCVAVATRAPLRIRWRQSLGRLFP